MADKAELRRAATLLRATCDPSLGTRLAAHILRDPPPPGAIIAGFWPLADEIDTRDLLHTLAANGHRIALPQTPPRGVALTFHAWHPGDTMLPGRFGTLYPPGEILHPDFILVPLLAFDPTGNRLGYGGGYYDRTFAHYPKAYRLGCAYAAQRMNNIPTEAHDVKLHAVATEQGIERMQQESSFL